MDHQCTCSENYYLIPSDFRCWKPAPLFIAPVGKIVYNLKALTCVFICNHTLFYWLFLWRKYFNKKLLVRHVKCVDPTPRYSQSVEWTLKNWDKRSEKYSAPVIYYMGQYICVRYLQTHPQLVWSKLCLFWTDLQATNS